MTMFRLDLVGTELLASVDAPVAIKDPQCARETTHTVHASIPADMNTITAEEGRRT